MVRHQRLADGPHPSRTAAGLRTSNPSPSPSSWSATTSSDSHSSQTVAHPVCPSTRLRSASAREAARGRSPPADDAAPRVTSGGSTGCAAGTGRTRRTTRTTSRRGRTRRVVRRLGPYVGPREPDRSGRWSAARGVGRPGTRCRPSARGRAGPHVGAPHVRRVSRGGPGRRADHTASAITGSRSNASGRWNHPGASRWNRSCTRAARVRSSGGNVELTLSCALSVTAPRPRSDTADGTPDRNSAAASSPLRSSSSASAIPRAAGSHHPDRTRSTSARRPAAARSTFAVDRAHRHLELFGQLGGGPLARLRQSMRIAIRRLARIVRGYFPIPDSSCQVGSTRWSTWNPAIPPPTVPSAPHGRPSLEEGPSSPSQCAPASSGPSTTCSPRCPPTVRPRVSGTEVVFRGDDLFLGSMWHAVKARDLQRDGRFAIHRPGAPEMVGGDTKLSGVAVEVVGKHATSSRRPYSPRHRSSCSARVRERRAHDAPPRRRPPRRRAVAARPRRHHDRTRAERYSVLITSNPRARATGIWRRVEGGEPHAGGAAGRRRRGGWRRRCAAAGSGRARRRGRGSARRRARRGSAPSRRAARGAGRRSGRVGAEPVDEHQRLGQGERRRAPVVVGRHRLEHDSPAVEVPGQQRGTCPAESSRRGPASP